MIAPFSRGVFLCVTMLVVAGISSFAAGGDKPEQSGTSTAARSTDMEITIFARFHALEGEENEVASELRDAVTRVRTEPGCLAIEAYGSVRDPRLFWIHSRWTDEAAFERHAKLAATNQFVERVQRLIDHPFDVTRARVLR